jgi:hypothetical protein
MGRSFRENYYSIMMFPVIPPELLVLLALAIVIQFTTNPVKLAFLLVIPVGVVLPPLYWVPAAILLGTIAAILISDAKKK